MKNAILNLRRSVVVRKIGLIKFKDAYKIQSALASKHLDERRDGKEKGVDTLLLLEHHPVYTTGIRHQDYNLDEEMRLKKLGAEFIRTNRGGLVTFHGPGQLVVYPVLNLCNFKKSIKWYVHQLESTIIKMCEKFSISAETSPHTGVWVNDNKLAAIGIHGCSFVTTHGLAINCNTDMRWFSHIVPCGIADKGVTSLSEILQRTVTVQETIPHFLSAFGEQFECDLVESPN